MPDINKPSPGGLIDLLRYVLENSVWLIEDAVISYREFGVWVKELSESYLEVGLYPISRWNKGMVEACTKSLIYWKA